MNVSPSRRISRRASNVASDGEKSTAIRKLAVQIAQVHAILELAYQIGRLADQVPVYGPPEEK